MKLDFLSPKDYSELHHSNIPISQVAYQSFAIQLAKLFSETDTALTEHVTNEAYLALLSHFFSYGLAWDFEEWKWLSSKDSKELVQIKVCHPSERKQLPSRSNLVSHAFLEAFWDHCHDGEQKVGRLIFTNIFEWYFLDISAFDHLTEDEYLKHCFLQIEKESIPIRPSLERMVSRRLDSAKEMVVGHFSLYGKPWVQECDLHDPSKESIYLFKALSSLFPQSQMKTPGVVWRQVFEKMLDWGGLGIIKTRKKILWEAKDMDDVHFKSLSLDERRLLCIKVLFCYFFIKILEHKLCKNSLVSPKHFELCLKEMDSFQAFSNYLKKFRHSRSGKRKAGKEVKLNLPGVVHSWWRDKGFFEQISHFSPQKWKSFQAILAPYTVHIDSNSFIKEGQDLALKPGDIKKIIRNFAKDRESPRLRELSIEHSSWERWMNAFSSRSVQRMGSFSICDPCMDCGEMIEQGWVSFQEYLETQSQGIEHAQSAKLIDKIFFGITENEQKLAATKACLWLSLMERLSLDELKDKKLYFPRLDNLKVGQGLIYHIPLSADPIHLKELINRAKHNDNSLFAWQIAFPGKLKANGEFAGFDVILSNFNSLEENLVPTNRNYFSRTFDLYDYHGKAYMYAMELATRLTPHGQEIYALMPTVWQTAYYGRKFRNWLTKKREDWKLEMQSVGHDKGIMVVRLRKEKALEKPQKQSIQLSLAI